MPNLTKEIFEQAKTSRHSGQALRLAADMRDIGGDLFESESFGAALAVGIAMRQQGDISNDKLMQMLKDNLRPVFEQIFIVGWMAREFSYLQSMAEPGERGGKL